MKTVSLILFQVCVGQILRVIQLLGTTPRLRAVTLRLLTSLWEKQVSPAIHLLHIKRVPSSEEQ